MKQETSHLADESPGDVVEVPPANQSNKHPLLQKGVTIANYDATMTSSRHSTVIAKHMETMMTLKKEMTARIPDRNERKQRLENFEAHEEDTSQDSAASLFELYLEEQTNFRFTNQRLQTEKKKYEQQLQEENEEEKGQVRQHQWQLRGRCHCHRLDLPLGVWECEMCVPTPIGKGRLCR
jgi:hypothetical protein